MASILNTINSNLSKPGGLNNNRRKLQSQGKTEEAKLYDNIRYALDQLPTTLTPSNDFKLRDLSGHFDATGYEKTIQTLEVASNLLSGKEKAGRILTYDMETVGGVKAIDYHNKMTNQERLMLGITELAVHQDVFENGKITKSLSDVYTFGIANAQKTYYDAFFKEIETKSMKEAFDNPSYASTLERLSRYSGNFNEVFGTYERNGQKYLTVKKIQESTIDLDKAKQGYENLLKVGQYQGLDTKRGRGIWKELRDTFHADDVKLIAGYNNEGFDNHVFNEVADLFKIKDRITIDSNRSYDVLKTLKQVEQGASASIISNQATLRGIELDDTKGALKLETRAKALGIEIDAHLATSDTRATARIGYKDKVYDGKNLPDYALGVLKNEQEKLLENSLSIDNLKDKVAFVNKSYMNPEHGISYLKENGRLVTVHDWVLPRGEAFKVSEIGFTNINDLTNHLSLAQEIDNPSEQVGRILSNYNAKDGGLYSLTLQGASQYNKEKEVKLFFGSQEELHELFQSNLNLRSISKTNESANTPGSVTQSMVDTLTKNAQKDRARRDLLSYFHGNGSYGYNDLKKNLGLYEDMVGEFNRLGLKNNKENLRAFLSGELDGVDTKGLFEKNGVSQTTSRKTSFEHLHGVFQSSDTALKDVVTQIDHEFTDAYVNTLLSTDLVGNTKKLEEVKTLLKQETLSDFISKYEFLNTHHNETVKDVYSLMLPTYDKFGKVTDTYREVNFTSVQTATSQIYGIIRGSSDKNVNQTIQNLEQQQALKHLTNHLADLNLIPKELTNLTDKETSAYMLSQTIAKHIHDGFGNLIESTGEGYKGFIKNEKKLNETLSSIINDNHLATDIKLFAEGYQTSRSNQPINRLNLNSLQVRETGRKLKTTKSLNKASETKYFKQSLAESITQTKEAYQSFSLQNRSSFYEKTHELLSEKYGYLDQEISEIENLLFGWFDSKNNPKGLVSKHNLSATLFEQDGRLYIGATDKEKSFNFMKAIKQAESIDDIKKQGLVIPLPEVTDELGIRTIKQGTSHKVINERFHAYVDKSVNELNPSGFVRTQKRNTVSDSIAAANIVMDKAMDLAKKGEFEEANKMFNSRALKPISDASGLTSRQTIVDKATGRLTTGYILNKNDIATQHDVNASMLYSYLPFLYDHDEEVRNKVNKIAYAQYGGKSESEAGMKFINQQKDKLIKRQALKIEGGTELPIENEFLKNMQDYMKRIVDIGSQRDQYGNTLLDARSLDAIRSTMTDTMSQTLGEKRVQSGIINTKAPVHEVPLAFISGTTRPAVNAGRNTLAIDTTHFKEEELRRLTSLGVEFGDRLVTHEGYDTMTSFRANTDGRFSQYVDNYTAKFKAVSTHEGLALLEGLESEKEAILAALNEAGHTFSEADFDYVKRQMMANMNTHEQRIVLHNAMLSGSWADAEQTSFKAKGLSEELLDKLVDDNFRIEPGTVLGEIEVNGEFEKLRYNKQVSGHVVSRDGQTLYIQPDQRSTNALKLSLGGYEKGMGFVTELEDESRLSPLFDQMWASAFGQDVVALANPEMAKHEATTVMLSRYLTTASEAVVGTEYEDHFLNLLNHHLPGFNASFVDDLNGKGKILAHAGNPVKNADINYLDRFQAVIASMEALANEETNRSGINDVYKGIMDRIQAQVENEEYRVSIARTTSSEQIPSNQVKSQMRGQQVLGTQKVDGFYYEDKLTGEMKRYADTLNKWEQENFRRSSKSQEAYEYIQSLNTALHGATGKDELYGVSDKIKSVKFEDLALPESNISAEQMQKTFFDVHGKPIKDPGIQAYRIDIGHEIVNPLTKETTKEIVIPKAIVHSTDGQVYLTGVDKATADLLQAINELKTNTSDKTLEGAKKAVEEAYENVFNSYVKEYRNKDGVLMKDVLQGRLNFSSRGLASNIESPLTESMWKAYQEGGNEGLSQAVETLKEELREGKTQNLIFKQKEAYKHATRTLEDGTVELLDTVKTSKTQLLDMGVNFESIGRQVTGEAYWNHDLDAYQSFLDEIKHLAPERILDEKTGKMVSYVSNEYFKQVGEHYLREHGLWGIYGRDPYFQYGSRRVSKVYLDDNVQGKAFSIYSWMAKLLEQDTDGDNTNVTLLLKEGKDGEGLLYNKDHKIYHHAEAIRDAQARYNTGEDTMIAALDGYNLSSKATGRSTKVGGEIEVMMEEFAKNYGEHFDGHFFSSDVANKRAIQSRYSKVAIGHLSVPNYLIREASSATFLNLQSYDKESFELINELTRVAEQKLISTKHLKGDADDMLNTLLYVRGVRELFNTNEDSPYAATRRIGAVDTIIESFMGPVFNTKTFEEHGFKLTGENVLSGEILNTIKDLDFLSEKDKEVIAGLHALTQLTTHEKAKGIYNSQFIKERFSNFEGALNELVSGIETHGSVHLEQIKAFTPTKDMFTVSFGDQEVGPFGDLVLGHGGTHYQTGAYRPGSLKELSDGGVKATLISLDGKSSISLSGEDTYDIIDQIKAQFKPLSQGNLMELESDFAENFLRQSASNLQAFHENKVLTSTLHELSEQGQFDIINLKENYSNFLDDFQKTLRQNLNVEGLEGEALDSVVSRLMRQAKGYSAQELGIMSDLHASFTSAQGQAIGDFAALTDHLIQHNQLSRSQGSEMLKAFNDSIRTRAENVTRENILDARSSVFSMYSPKHFSNAALDKYTSEALKDLDPFTEVISPQRAREQVLSHTLIDRADFNQRVSEKALELKSTMEKANAIQEGMGRGKMFDDDAMTSMLLHEFAAGQDQLLHETNTRALQGRYESFMSLHQKQGEQSFGWLDDVDLKRSSHTPRDLAKALEDATLFGGNLTGHAISDVSLGDLRHYLSDTSFLRERDDDFMRLVDRSKAHVSSYLNALENLGSGNDYVRHVMDRETNLNAGLIKQSHAAIEGVTVNELNDAIRQKASQSARQLGDDVHLSSSATQAIAKTTPHLKLGTGMMLASAAMMTGMQFTANQSMLKANRQAKEDYEIQETPTFGSKAAPPSGYNGRSAYLNETVHYNISAQNNGRANMRDIESSINRMTGIHSLNVHHSDNRQEISDKWLETKMLGLL